VIWNWLPEFLPSVKRPLSRLVKPLDVKRILGMLRIRDAHPQASQDEHLITELYALIIMPHHGVTFLLVRLCHLVK